MKELAILLRAMQLYTQNAHNLVEKSLFFQDHDYLGELYSTYESGYDSIIERIIGLTDSSQLDLKQIQLSAVNILQQLPSKETENMVYFQRIESMENNLRQKIAQINPGVSIGTQQLIGGMADESEKRSYKIKQRIKGGK
jgi:DNA-binding ferritin-like protein